MGADEIAKRRRQRMIGIAITAAYDAICSTLTEPQHRKRRTSKADIDHFEVGSGVPATAEQTPYLSDREGSQLFAGPVTSRTKASASFASRLVVGCC